MKKQLSVFFFIFFTINSCIKHCEDLRGLGSSALLVYPFNGSMNNYFYPQDEFRSPFKKDSLEVINEDGRRFPNISFLLVTDPRNALQAFYAIKISSIFMPDDSSAFHTEKRRKIYLKYSYNTYDTLTLVFKAKKTKCDNSTYEYLKVYHRDSLLKSVSNDIGTDFTLNH